MKPLTPIFQKETNLSIRPQKGCSPLYKVYLDWLSIYRGESFNFTFDDFCQMANESDCIRHFIQTILYYRKGYNGDEIESLEKDLEKYGINL